MDEQHAVLISRISLDICISKLDKKKLSSSRRKVFILWFLWIYIETSLFPFIFEVGLPMNVRFN